MKIETPLRTFEEVQPLLKAGADIFYCGVLDRGVNNRNNLCIFGQNRIEAERESSSFRFGSGCTLFCTDATAGEN